jgi:hypothetical protein
MPVASNNLLSQFVLVTGIFIYLNRVRFKQSTMRTALFKTKKCHFDGAAQEWAMGRKRNLIRPA